MATKNTTRKKSAPAPAPAPAPEAAANDGGPTGQSLDQVRDILFGGQMRAVESRLERLEGRLMREVEAARAEGATQAEALGARLTKEVERLAEKLQAERAKRGDDLKALAADLKQAVKDLDKRLAALDNATSKADADLRDQIMEHAMAASANLERVGDDLRTALEQETHELRSEKADTASLIALFSDMALRLTDDLPTPPES